ncbi:MAG: hypothetical protein II784_05450, partial [Oscillospiraceae bacterium]|nr:hypothetical protein [Oscillospiraceae bacterium]
APSEFSSDCLAEYSASEICAALPYIKSSQLVTFSGCLRRIFAELFSREPALAAFAAKPFFDTSGSLAGCLRYRRQSLFGLLSRKNEFSAHYPLR